MKQGLFSKYQCDNKLKIYTDAPLNNFQYKKMIENAKPRYMNDYYNAPKFNRRKNEKSFNSLLDSYFSDFKQMKKKYNFLEPEETQEEYLEEQNNYIDYEEFENKKNTLYELFSSYDIPDIDQINFDLTDKLVRSMYNKKNDSLLKNTQTKDDYDLRLNDIENNPKYNPSLRKKDHEQIEDSKVIENNEEKELSDNENPETKIPIQPKEDPLKAFQDMVINNDYPLFEQLINPFFPTKYIPQPCFPLKPGEEIEEKDFDKNEENEYEREFDENEENKEKEEEYDDFDKDNNENGNNIEEKKDEDEILKLMNNQKINGDNDLLMFENIISNDFRDDYIIPSYKMPCYIEEEIKKEEEKRKKEKEDYEKNKNQNILNKSENGEIKMLDDIIKEEEQNKKVEEINNLDNKIVYNPQNDFKKSENDENNIQNKNVRYDGYEERGFIQASANEEIKNDMVENIINSNKNENYSLPQYSTPNPAQNEEEKNEDMKKEMMGDIVRKKYNEEEIKDFGEKEEEKVEEKKEEENKKESINNNANKSDDNFDKIVVDELNDDEIEDNEEKYGFE